MRKSGRVEFEEFLIKKIKFYRAQMSALPHYIVWPVHTFLSAKSMH